MTCGTCAWENAAGSASCAGCGSALAPAPSGPPRSPAPPSSQGPPRSAAPQYDPAPAYNPAPAYGPAPQYDPAPPAQPGYPPPGAGPAVPRRSIPVRIAPTPTRQIRPVRAAPPPRPTDMPAQGELRCRRCGLAQPSDRRFCDCGAGLVGLPSADPPPPPRAPSWGAEWGAHRRFRAAQRLAARGAPVGYDAPLSTRTRAVRVVGGLLVAAVLGSQVGPWGADVRREVGDRVDRVVGTLSADRTPGGRP